MTGSAMYFAAHEDDDLLFLSPDLIHDIDSGRGVVTVFVTAGDAGEDSTYWLGREGGMEIAYALMADVENDWFTEEAGSRDLHMRTLQDRPDVSLVFMRLPDGFPLGTGSALYNQQSLQRLLMGDISSIAAADGSQTYTWDDLVATLSELLDQFAPTDIHTLDYVGDFDDGDQSDHHAVAFAVEAAAQNYESAHSIHAHQGYGIRNRPENVTGEELERKSDAYYAYASHDADLDPQVFADFLPRSYLLDATPSAPSDGMDNLAQWASITASSQDFLSGQTSDKAVDDSALGYPSDPSREWATEGEGAGSWIELSWDEPVTLSRIVLFDRPNVDDHVMQGTLNFSDGSSVPTGPLDNRGYRTDVIFQPRTVTSVRFVVDDVSPETANVGLAEIQAWGNESSPPDL